LILKSSPFIMSSNDENSSHQLAIPEDAKEVPEVLSVHVQDDRESPWGCRINFLSWRILRVESGRQMEKLGVKKGLRLIRVNGLDVKSHARDVEKILEKRVECDIEFTFEDAVGESVVVNFTFRTRGKPSETVYEGWTLKVLKKDYEKEALLVDHELLKWKQWLWRDDLECLSFVPDAFSSNNIPENYEFDMFPIDDISSLISESCLLYDYQDVSKDIMDFAFHFVRVYVLNFERNVTLVISQPATVRDVFKFSKKYFGMKNHLARMFVPSRWFHKLPRRISLDFSDNYDMNTHVEASRDSYLWNEKLSDISFFQNDLIEITFASENDPGSIDFPEKESTEPSVGMIGVARDKYGKWYHAQILSILGGAEVIRRIQKVDTGIDVDETYFFIHWIGFKHTWNEWMSSERFHRKNEGFFTMAEAKILGFAELVDEWKWFPRTPFKEISVMPMEFY